MDIQRFIAEIRSRPGLWNIHSEQYKDRILINKLWKEVAKIVGANVEECKRKWRNLRDAYRAEVRRSERRMARDMLIGVPCDKKSYKSKWVYFDDLEFMRSYKRRSCLEENANSNSNDYDDDYGEPDNDYYNDETFESSIEIKTEPIDDLIYDDSLKHQDFIEDDEEMAREMTFQGFKIIELDKQTVKNQAGLDRHSVERDKKPSADENLNVTSSSLPVNGVKSNCTKLYTNHVNFPKSKGPEEQELVTLTKQKKVDSLKLENIGDSDFNFLVSFLPHMKRMNTLQNLQFRAKMSEVILNTLSPTLSEQRANSQN